jgi:hypothetical protein
MAKEGRTHLRFRIDPELQKRVEAAAKKSGRTLTAEIAERLKQSFDIPALVDRLAPDASDIASEVSSDIGTEFSSVHTSFSEVQSQLRAILLHLGLPDPVEVEMARKAEAYAKRKAERERGLKEALQTIERAGFDITKTPDSKDSKAKDSKDGEKK